MSERRELTDEERKKLIGYLPFSKEETIEYTPPAYLVKDEAGAFLMPDGYRPVFTIKPMQKTEYDKAMKIQIEVGQGASTKLGKQIGIRDIVQESIAGWTDLVDLGKMAEFKFEKTEDCISKLPWPLILDIFMYLLKVSGLMPGEKLGLK